VLFAPRLHNESVDFEFKSQINQRKLTSVGFSPPSDRCLFDPGPHSRRQDLKHTFADMKLEQIMQDSAAFARVYPLSRHVQPGIYAAYFKRPLDLILAVLMLPILVPVIAFLWLMVRRDGGAGFFGHTRVGRDGKSFKCWKMRSMEVDAEAKLACFLKVNPAAAAEWARDHKLVNDPRITGIGSFLRKSSLDELPQIWNVLKGDMSFVGPRPVVADELSRYGASKWAYLQARPGITGLWQVSGRNDVSYENRVAMDVRYSSDMRLGRDLWIMACTAGAVVQGTGK
jgi:exopolysaccharide production protein ExoY